MTNKRATKARRARERRIERGYDQESSAREMMQGIQGLMQLPLLEAIEEAGGSARPRDLYGEVAAKLNLAPDVRTHRRDGGDQEYAIFDQQVRWTRQTLVGKGLIAGERGIWELTDKGKAHLSRVNRGSVVLVYSLDDGLAFLAHAEEASGAIEPDSLSLILTSPPYPVVGREYGKFTVPAWLEWMSGLVGLWKALLTEQGTLAINVMDVHVPGSAMLSPYIERFTLDAIDKHGLHLAGRMPWHSPNKLGNLEWAIKRRVSLRNTVEHILLFSKTTQPGWDTRRLPPEPFASRSPARMAADRNRGTSRRPGGYDINEEAFQRTGDGRVPGNLIVSGGAGGGGTYGEHCRADGLPLHPARFPEEIPRRVIQLATEPGQIVYDPMAGSNTTGKVALELGRRFISSEPVLDYVRGSAGRFSSRPDFRNHFPSCERRRA